MDKLRRFFNQNQKSIILSVIAIVFAIAIIQILNNVAKKNVEEEKKELQNNYSQTSYSNYTATHSVVSGGNISSEKSKQLTTIIYTFIENCNSGKMEEAYNLLSQDCKEQIYPTLEIFKNNYYKQNFKTKKMHSEQLWITNTFTYKVDLYEDLLATGNSSAQGIHLQDYWSIVKENDELKLNISEYIGKQIINKHASRGDIEVTVNYKNIFKDYEIYNITIINNTNNTILMDSFESTQKMYLEGQNEAKFLAYSHEINKDDLKIKSYYKNTLNIKYNKQYTPGDNKVSSIYFTDIILNVEEYENTSNKVLYDNRTFIKIDI